MPSLREICSSLISLNYLFIFSRFILFALQINFSSSLAIGKVSRTSSHFTPFAKSSEFSHMPRKKVAIIGAGASGLISAFTTRKYGLSPIVFESNPYVGGVWKYSINSPLYDSLITNLPKEIMEYSKDFPFDSSLPSFVTHFDVQKYLEDFCSSHELNPLIKLSCNVISTKKTSNNKWKLTYKYEESVIESEDFDYLFVCNGHFNVPTIPHIEGQENFKGEIFHSKEYKTPQKYENKSIMIIGARSSGTDIARELSDMANHIHISDRNFNNEQIDPLIKIKSNIFHHGAISKITSDGSIEFSNGDIIDIDCIIWCTGYEYEYPFLESFNVNSDNDINLNTRDGTLQEPSTDPPAPPPTPPVTSSLSSSLSFSSIKLSVMNRSVRPLYLHLFHIDDPTLIFLGLPQHVIPFPLFTLQAEYAARVCADNSHNHHHLSLPNRREQLGWLRDFEQSLTDRGVPPHRYFCLGDRQWEYAQQLVQGIGVADEEIFRYLRTNREIYEDNSAHRPVYTGAPDDYRKRQYRVDRSTGEWWVVGGDTEGPDRLDIDL